VTSVLGCFDAQPRKPLQGAVVILLDTVRPDHLSPYGYSRPTSPNLEQLAKMGVLFERVVSCAPWTRPSVAAILSGQYPGALWGEDVFVSQSLVESLRKSGYLTAAFTEGGYVSRKYGMDRGFDTYVEETGAIVAPKPTGGIANTFRQAQAWLAGHKDDRFFLLIHTYEPHAPYINRDFAKDMATGVIGDRFSIELLPELQSGKLTLTPAEVEYVRALYDGDLLNTDRFVGKFLDVLRELSLGDRTLVVVTSDHGEEMGDHFPANIGDHGHSLYDDLLLVPLIIYDPRQAYAVKRVESQVRTIDIFPTISELLGVPQDDSNLDGATLVPIMKGIDHVDRQALSSWTHKGALRVSLRDRGFKYVANAGAEETRPPILNPPPDHELFDLALDPGEKNNLYDARPELAKAMHESMMKRREQVLERRSTPPRGVDRELDERLKSLGYVR
jgi:arylsulfatase A-like enzyme